MPTLTKIELTKPWTDYEGQQWSKGSLLEVDSGTLSELLSKGIARLSGTKAAGQRPYIPQPDSGYSGVDTPDPTFGYHNKGGLRQFLADVMSSAHGHLPDRLMQSQRQADDLKQRATAKAFASGLTTKAVGSDELSTVEGAMGEFLIPPEFSADFFQKQFPPPIARQHRATVLPVSVGTSTVIPVEVDEDRDQESDTLFGGIRAYRDKELTTLSSSRPKFGQVQVTPAPLTCLVYATMYEINRAPNLVSILQSQVERAFSQTENREHIKGSGAGESMGITNASCKYEQAAEDGQAAGTIVTENILKMWARGYMPEEAVWLASQSTFEWLMTLTIDVGTGGAPVRLFDMSRGAPGELLGRPVIFTEFCETVGTAGDLILAHWPSYLIGDSTFYLNDSSIHVRFVNAQEAFRFIKYTYAQPWWRTTLTLSNDWEVSPFVTLAAR